MPGGPWSVSLPGPPRVGRAARAHSLDRNWRGPVAITGALYQRADRRRPRFEQPMLTIQQRPFHPEDRSEARHWEARLTLGKHQLSAIGTLVERQTSTVRLLHLPLRDGDTLQGVEGSDGGPAT